MVTAASLVMATTIGGKDGTLGGRFTGDRYPCEEAGSSKLRQN